MSYATTVSRPLARGGWGGKAASHFRGQSFRGQSFRGQSFRGQVGTVIYRSLGVAVNFALTGISRDSAGVALGNCVIELFQTGGDIITQTTMSDAGGNFSFSNPSTGPFYLNAYKVGSPDVAGTTVNTLYPSAV